MPVVPYLMIDPETVTTVAAQLASARTRANVAQSDALAASSLAELAIAAIAMLDQLDELLQHTSQQLASAATTAASFRLPAIDAGPATPWNHVEQLASHNSYAHPGAIADLYERGFRTFELDAHRGDPTEFSLAGKAVPSWLASIGIDAIGHRSDRNDDWRVYHHSLDTASAYRWLSDGLVAVAALPPADPITVFVDIKDSFGGGHDPVALDELLVEGLGDRLYRPSDLLLRDRGAATLTDAVQVAGWPSAAELQGRVMVVLTDEVAEYRSSGVEHAAAFVATGPAVGSADPNVLFYNVRDGQYTPDEIEQMRSDGALVRVWGGDGTAANANYVAVDVDEFNVSAD